MNNANTAEGLGYLFAVFKTFPVLQVLLAAFIVYLLARIFHEAISRLFFLGSEP